MLKFTFRIIGGFCLLFMIASNSHAQTKPTIAKWYLNKQSAVSLRFDDAMDSHVKIAIPTLNEHDLKATFMINPGRKIYQKNQSFWEIEVPRMGHHLGNHTLHHEGAETIEEADYEIGEVSRLIWSLYPDSSKLHVFASGGGGKKWGGKPWEEADSSYKALVDKYHMIDLYDGNHRSKALRSVDTIEAACERIDSALSAGSYQPFHFHNIGSPTIKDRLNLLRYGHSMAVDQQFFMDFINCLLSKREEIWIAPMVDILKYQTEYEASNISNIKRKNGTISFDLSIAVDTKLYDHELTLLLPNHQSRKPVHVLQDGRKFNVSQLASRETVVNISAINSTLVVVYD